MAAVQEHHNGRLRVRRFDADKRDRELTLEQALAAEPTDRQLLWVDVTGDIEARELEDLGKRFELATETRHALESPTDRPHLAVHGSHFRLSVASEPATTHERHASWLHVVAGKNIVITRHAEPLRLLDEIDRRVKSDTTLGAVEGAEFVALLLDAVVTSYFAAVDDLEEAIDDLDSASLRDDVGRTILDDLVRLRRRIASLRHIVSRHRRLFAALSGPDMRQVVHGQDAVSDLQQVATRYEAAVLAVESSRDALLGSFDVYMTRTAQRTNDVMKVLTIATVLLLPGGVIAGLLGMNVIVPLDKDDPMSFWLVVGGVAVLAIVVLVAARRRRWI